MHKKAKLGEIERVRQVIFRLPQLYGPAQRGESQEG